VFKKARKPAYQLPIDFGEFGIKKSSVQITAWYQIEDLVGQQIVGVLNFPPKQITNRRNEYLVLGSVDVEEKVVLQQAERAVKNELKIS
jgi:tRNA-binding protein